MKFVKIQGTIYDYSQYRLNILGIKKLINDEIETAVSKIGFVRQRENIFYNKKFDLLLQILIKNKSKPKFV